MIISSLKTLLAVQDIKVLTLAKAINAPRTFIQNLIDNKFQLINTQYLNSLCQYFRIEIDDIIHYYPYDINIEIDDFNMQIIVTLEHHDRVNPTSLEKIKYDFHINIKYLKIAPDLPILDISKDDFELWCLEFKDMDSIILNWLFDSIEEKYRTHFNYNRENIKFTLRTTGFIDIEKLDELEGEFI